MRIIVDVPDKPQSDALRYQEIITALIGSGAFDLKNGKAVIHFDAESVFQGVQLEYWAYKRRKG